MLFNEISENFICPLGENFRRMWAAWHGADSQVICYKKKQNNKTLGDREAEWCGALYPRGNNNLLDNLTMMKIPSCRQYSTVYEKRTCFPYRKHCNLFIYNNSLTAFRNPQPSECDRVCVLPSAITRHEPEHMHTVQMRHIWLIVGCYYFLPESNVSFFSGMWESWLDFSDWYFLVSCLSFIVVAKNARLFRPVSSLLKHELHGGWLAELGGFTLNAADV